MARNPYLGKQDGQKNRHPELPGFYPAAKNNCNLCPIIESSMVIQRSHRSDLKTCGKPPTGPSPQIQQRKLQKL